ncbi:hypothetical protein HW49_06165 [Porphyromonadaceae bacterium COT-184 OH4590]|nr:hypothetical protein HW49_06165 [Porphyromonadaceae bacterium COT-184 OH4590]
MKNLNLLTLIIAATVLSFTNCKREYEQPKKSFSIEKQWLLPEEVDIELEGVTLKAKILFDISVTKPGYFIYALQQKDLAALLGIAPNSWFYQEINEVSIQKKDETSGSLKIKILRDDGEYKESTIDYENLSENTVTLKSEEGETEVTAIQEKIQLVYVEP